MKTKVCRDCGNSKPITEFYKDKHQKDGYRYDCIECNKSHGKEYRNGKEGMIQVTYTRQIRNSENRGHKPPTYTIMELKWWMFSQPLFYELYEEYKNSNYNQWSRPSVDRINNYEGYSLDNIQLATWKENSENFIKDLKSGKYKVEQTSQAKPVNQYDIDGVFIQRHESLTAAAKSVNSSTNDIKKVCDRYRSRKTSHGYKWEWCD